MTSRRIRQQGRRRSPCASDDRRAGLLYCFTLTAVTLSIGILYNYRVWSLLALLAAPLAIAPVRLALSDQEGRALLPMLGSTARLQIVTGALPPHGLLL